MKVISKKSGGLLKALYTSPTGRHVHSDTYLASRESIKPYRNCGTNTIHSHISTAVYSRYSFIQLSELGHRGDNENARASKRQQRGFEPVHPQLRVRCSTTELLRSTNHNYRVIRRIILEYEGALYQVEVELRVSIV